MSSTNVVNPAWIAVPPADSLPEAVTAHVGPIEDKIGFTPNVARLLAISPRHFVGWWSYFDDLMRGPSGLSKTQREMIAVVVSAESRCPYCEVAHAAALRLRTKDPALVDRLAVNYRHVQLPCSDRAMLDFAVKLTHTPQACDEADVTRLRKGRVHRRGHPPHRRGHRDLQLQPALPPPPGCYRTSSTTSSVDPQRPAGCPPLTSPTRMLRSMTREARQGLDGFAAHGGARRERR